MNARSRFFHYSIILLISYLLFCALPASPAKISTTEIEEFDAILQGYIDEDLASGVIAYVYHDNDVAYLKALGRMNIENHVPMQSDTIFRIASMTKPITTVAVMKLFEEGLLSLDDPISKYIPEFKNPTVLEAGSTTPIPAKREITIRHLLSHTSGITYRLLERNEEAVKRYIEAGITDGLSQTEGTIGDKIKILAKLPLIAHPGEAWEYGLSDDVLGYLIEIVTGKTFAQYLQEQIFDPLDMKDTHFFLPQEKVSRLARLYAKSDSGLKDVGEEIVDAGALVYSSSYPYSGPQTYYSGGAGLCSTVLDYARFCQMLLNKGTLEGTQILDSKTVETMTQNQIGDLKVNLAPDHYKYGFGVAVNTGGGTTSAGEYSWSGFWSTYFWIDPQEELIGIIMAQTFPMQPILDRFQKQVYQSIVPKTAAKGSLQQ